MLDYAYIRRNTCILEYVADSASWLRDEMHIATHVTTYRLINDLS